MTPSRTPEQQAREKIDMLFNPFDPDIVEVVTREALLRNPDKAVDKKKEEKVKEQMNWLRMMKDHIADLNNKLVS